MGWVLLVATVWVSVMIGSRQGGCRPVITVAAAGYDSIVRSITAAFVVRPPAGARVRTRLRPSQQDAVVVAIVGEYLGGWPAAILPAAAGWGLALTAAPIGSAS
jgi:hypothetical protein